MERKASEIIDDLIQERWYSTFEPLTKGRMSESAPKVRELKEELERSLFALAKDSIIHMRDAGLIS